MKSRRHERTFELLSRAAVNHGIDRIVEDPIDFVAREFNISRSSAWNNIKNLERLGLVAFSYDGARISRLRLLKDKLPKVLHEEDDMKRVLMALWKHRHSSQYDPKVQIVHSSLFCDIQRDADVLQTELYQSLKRFSENGWIVIKYSEISRKTKINCLIISDLFPVNLVE